MKSQKPINLNTLSKDELHKELMKGYESIKHDQKYSPEEVDLILEKEFHTK